MKTIDHHISQSAAARVSRRKEFLLFGVLAVAVILCVVWALHVTGVADIGKPTCGMEEHTHTDACYEQKLVCELEEGAVETEAVADEAKADEAEAEGAEPTEAEAAEAEGEAAVPVPVPAAEEKAEGHTHTDACYEKVLTCTIPEHVHDTTCYPSGNDDAQKALFPEDVVPSDLTGKWDADMVAVAQSQLGMQENSADVKASADGATEGGFTRYGERVDDAYGPWANAFTLFCMHFAGMDDKIPSVNDAEEWASLLQRGGLYTPALGYVPTPGDIVFLDTNDDGKPDSTAVVEKVDEDMKSVTIIRGDAQPEGEKTEGVAIPDAVCEQNLALDSNTIHAYLDVTVAQEAFGGDEAGVTKEDAEELQKEVDEMAETEAQAEEATQDEATEPAEEGGTIDNPSDEVKVDEEVAIDGTQDEAAQTEQTEEADEPKAEEPGTPEFSYTQMVTVDGCTVIASYNDDARIPVDAKFKATRLMPKDEGYQEAYDRMVDALVSKVSLAEAEDLKAQLADKEVYLFDMGFERNGKEVEPAADVRITIKKVGEEGVQEGTYIHFADDGAEFLESTVNEDGTLSVDQSSFSDAVFIENFTYQTKGEVAALASSDEAVPMTYIKVKKVWDDAGKVNHSGHEVKVDLYAKNKGKIEGQQLTLNSANNWTDSFTAPVSEEGSDTPIQYYVRESKCTADSADIRYMAEIEYPEQTGSAWTKVDASSLKAGKEYVFVYKDGENSYALGATGSAPVQGSQLTVKNSTIKNGVSDSAIWTYSNGALKNKAANKYLKLKASYSYSYGNWKWTASWDLVNNNGSSITFSEHHLKSQAKSYGRTYNGYIAMGNGSVSSTDDGNKATSFDIYELVENTIVITNKPMSFVPVIPGGTTSDISPVKHNKTIDAFRVGDDNPTTTLDETLKENNADLFDHYRLYLDVEAESQPIDLVIVVDRSGSMHSDAQEGSEYKYKDATDVTGKNGLHRDVAVQSFLEGKGDVPGFIDEFLKINPENNIAISWFGGTWNANSEPYVNDAIKHGVTFAGKYFTDPDVKSLIPDFSKSGNYLYNYMMDSGTTMDWTTSRRSASGEYLGRQNIYVTNEQDEKIAAIEDWTPNSNQTYNNNNSFNFNNRDQYNVSGRCSNGTNYEAGLRHAEYMLRKDDEIVNNNHKKMVLFISDGLPTLAIAESDDIVQRYRGDTLFDKNTLGYDSNEEGGFPANGQRYKGGERFGCGQNDGFGVREETEQEIQRFVDNNPGVVVDSVGISLDKNGEDHYLKEMSNKTGGNVYLTNNMSSLMESIRVKIEAVSKVKITDHLSKYVRLYTNPDWEDPVTDEFADIQVWKTKVDPVTGKPELDDQKNPIQYCVWDNGKAEDIPEAKFDGSKNIIESVTYTVGDESASPTESTGTVTANFNEDYEMEKGWRYTLSFNVKTTNTAYEEFAESGYGEVIGDPMTDFESNEDNWTSSEKGGFRSNDDAYVEYKRSNTEFVSPYPHPVVQARATELPATGGPGTGMYLAIGGALMGIALLLGGRSLWRKYGRREA